MNIRFLTLFVVLANAICWSAYAATVPITINGTVTAPTCSINQDMEIDVDFGSLTADEVGTSKGTKTTRFPLDCAGATIELTINATASSFNDDYARTSIPNLAIKFTDENGRLLPMFTPVNINSSLRFMDIRTTLIKKTNAVLSGGNFRATASVVFEYK